MYCLGHAKVKGSDTSRQSGRQSNHHKWLVSKILSVEELETLAVGKKAQDITPSTTWRGEAWKEEELNDLP